jgi:hypothetical protein
MGYYKNALWNFAPGCRATDVIMTCRAGSKLYLAGIVLLFLMPVAVLTKSEREETQVMKTLVPKRYGTDV